MKSETEKKTAEQRVLFDTWLLGEEKWLFQLLNYSSSFTTKTLLSHSNGTMGS